MSVLPLVLLLTAAPVDAGARGFACSNVRPGDTAARLALRLTNSADNRHAPWFQSLDPATSRFVAKIAYLSIYPGWKVCIARRIRKPLDAAGHGPAESLTPTRPDDRSAALNFVYPR
jgi:hypothetical protein